MKTIFTGTEKKTETFTPIQIGPSLETYMCPVCGNRSNLRWIDEARKITVLGCNAVCASRMLKLNADRPTLEAVRYACALLLLQEHGLMALLEKATTRPMTGEEKAWVDKAWEIYKGQTSILPAPEQMRNALLANGWTPGSSGTVWKSPTGQRFLGPVQAYKIMCGVFASDHCNMCGCALRGDSEHAMGMCTAHANEGAGL